MAKLYFKYGAMGSSKSAQALITQFNYEELGMTVWLIKPSVDDRDGANIIRSRIGLQREAQVIRPDEDIADTFARARARRRHHCRRGAVFLPGADRPAAPHRRRAEHPRAVLRSADGFSHALFPRRTAAHGAGRFHHGDQDRVRLRPQGDRQRPHRRARPRHHRGRQILLGGNDSYVAMCHKCWVDKIRAQKEAARHMNRRASRILTRLRPGHGCWSSGGTRACPPCTAAPRAARC